MKYRIWTLLALTAAIAMLIQLSWQLPEVWNDPFAIISAFVLLVLGIVTGGIASHVPSTRRALRLLAFFFFVVLGVQWANSFRDDYLIWSFRWMCLGLLTGSFVPSRFVMGQGMTQSPSDEVEQDDFGSDEKSA